MSDQTTEQEIQAKGKTAPRITPDQINATIISESYFTAEDGALAIAAVNIGDAFPEQIFGIGKPLSLLTICVLVLKNGFTVTGESACASPENFDTEIGRKIARKNAVEKIWPLEGYLLKQQLSES